MLKKSLENQKCTPFLISLGRGKSGEFLLILSSSLNLKFLIFSNCFLAASKDSGLHIVEVSASFGKGQNMDRYLVRNYFSIFSTLNIFIFRVSYIFNKKMLSVLLVLFWCPPNCNMTFSSLFF